MSEQARRYRRHAVPGPDCIHPACRPAPCGTSRLPNISVIAEDRSEYPSLGPHTTRMFPNPRWRRSLDAAARDLRDGFDCESREARLSDEIGALTPTSRYRTSLHSAPKSFIRASASSRKFPFSTPDETRGMGISLDSARSGLDSPLDTVHSRPWRNERHDPRNDVYQRIWRIVLVLSRSPKLVQA